MLVILEVALIAALWGIAHRQLVGTMRFLTTMNQQARASTSQDADGYKPLARALSLLETGDPPDGGSGVYTCNTTILTNSGPAYFLITYQKQPPSPGSSNESWTVTSTQQALGSSDMAGWNSNLMPSTFAE